MNKAPLIAAAAVALLTLAACEQKAEEVDSRAPDPQKAELEKAAPVELPPSIAATVTFRCQPGNTLLYAEFFSGDKMVNVRTEKGGMPTNLKAPAAGEPYVADGGYKLTGNAKAATIQIAGSAPRTCKG